MTLGLMRISQKKIKKTSIETLGKVNQSLQLISHVKIALFLIIKIIVLVTPMPFYLKIYELAHQPIFPRGGPKQ